MSQRFRSFRGNILGSILFNVLGKFLTAALVFVSLKLISNQLDIEQYGVWTQFLFSVKMLVPLVVMQLETALIRFFHHQKYQAKLLWLHMLACILILNLIVSILLLLFPKYASELIFGSSAYMAYIKFIAVFTCTESVFLFLISYFRAAQKTNLFTAIRVVQSVFQLIALVIVLQYQGEELQALFSIFILINIFIISGLFVWIATKSPLRNAMLAFRWDSLRYFLHYAFPLMVSGFSAWFMYSSNRYFIAHFFDLELVGLYAAMSIFGSLVFMLQDAYQLLILPHCVALWEKGKRQLAMKYVSFMSDFYVVVAGLALLLVFTLGSPLLVLMSTPAFESRAVALTILTFSYILPGLDHRHVTLIHLEENTKTLGLITFTLAVFNGAINFMFISIWGIDGAIGCTLVTYLARLVWIRAIIRKKEQFIDYDFMLLFKFGATLLLFCLVISQFPVVQNFIDIIVYGLAIAMCYTCFVWLIGLLRIPIIRGNLREVREELQKINVKD